ncbi:LptA/OstA family protein [Sporolituus thermophilus]|uniref:Lipopolysaccharide export system protein LptA n=1 Tax=Sporolituus thermophilus DSM 23256 TaxID=1123285 RepID=A0A1G7NGK7_9FIRM|nr:LptA/OstA family protein [Sporolituus thermophilus]SDF72439.1 lipopolysaccharide export system protein LptA [Sporolituus thermophilus DSM 23256]
MKSKDTTLSRAIFLGIAGLLALALGFGPAAPSLAAGSPVELAAETIEYDTAQGIAIAEGGVRITRGNAVMTGAKAEYNTKTQEALVTGNVKVVQDDATITADQVQAYQNNHLVATGGVVLVKADSRLTGPRLDYYTDREYAIVTGGARLTTKDAVMTADKVEAFIAEDRAVGSGNVHIVSEARKLDATSDQATYYGAKTGQGRVVLTGNARAVQDGNVLTGNTLTVYLDDKAMDAQGRTRLVIKPQ